PDRQSSTGMASPTELAALRRALELAQAPDAQLGPNPRVGCVLVGTGGEVSADGYGRGAGERHAEVDALRRAGDRSHGAADDVTREPCNQTGRIGRCALALRETVVARVVYGQYERSPVAAVGAETMRAASVEVEGGVLAAQART